MSQGLGGSGPSLALGRTGRPGQAPTSHSNLAKLAAAADVFFPYVVTWIVQQPHESIVLIRSGKMVWAQKPHLTRWGHVWFENHSLDTPMVLLPVSMSGSSLASFIQTSHFVHYCLKDKTFWYCLYISITLVEDWLPRKTTFSYKWGGLCLCGMGCYSMYEVINCLLPSSPASIYVLACS